MHYFARRVDRQHAELTTSEKSNCDLSAKKLKCLSNVYIFLSKRGVEYWYKVRKKDRERMIKMVKTKVTFIYHCTHCLQDLNEDFKFCPKCGRSTDDRYEGVHDTYIMSKGDDPRAFIEFGDVRYDDSYYDEEGSKCSKCGTDYRGKPWCPKCKSKVRWLEDIIQYEIYKISDDVLPDCGIEFNGYEYCPKCDKEHCEVKKINLVSIFEKIKKGGDAPLFDHDDETGHSKYADFAPEYTERTEE